MLQICLQCGQVRESDLPLACARQQYHSGFPKMVELTEDVSYLGEPPHPLFGRSGDDPKLPWLRDLGPESVVIA